MTFPHSPKEHPMNTVITYSRYGGPEVLSASEAAIPQPGPGQVRIRVKAVAVNPIDAKIRSGRLDGFFPAQFPVLPGWDVAGVVDAVGGGTGGDGTGGEGASAAVGDEVFGVASAGGYSQYALLDRPVPKPAALSFETAAAVVTVGEAAFRVLKQLGLKAGQTLLILGAGGSVGSIAAQLAVARGITVIGTAADADLGRHHDRR
jgi:NADPH:quinone reductase-like Zn-dependent oxidoreductase